MKYLKISPDNSINLSIFAESYFHFSLRHTFVQLLTQEFYECLETNTPFFNTIYIIQQTIMLAHRQISMVSIKLVNIKKITIMTTCPPQTATAA